MTNKKTPRPKIEVIEAEIVWGQDTFKQVLLVYQFLVKKKCCSKPHSTNIWKEKENIYSGQKKGWYKLFSLLLL